MKPLLIGVGSLLLLIGAMDGALSLVGLGDPVLLQEDRDSGYVLKPNQNHYRFLVRTRINSHSMRSDQFSGQKQIGTYRIMFVGDSITYGTTRVDQSHIFTEILHRELPSIVHMPVEVLNASANAWGIPNEYGYVRSRGTFGSDAVVLVLNDGDFSQTKSTITDVGTQLYFTKPACALCELAGHYTQSHKQDKGTTNERDLAQEASNLRDLNALQELVHANHAAFLIMFVPFRKNVPNSSARVIQPELLTWAESNKVPVIDSTQKLGSLTISQASIDGGTHLSPTGNISVARAFESFAEHGLAEKN